MKKPLVLTSMMFILLILVPIMPSKTWGNSLLTNPAFVIAHGEKENLLAIPQVTLIVHPDAKKG